MHGYDCTRVGRSNHLPDSLPRSLYMQSYLRRSHEVLRRRQAHMFCHQLKACSMAPCGPVHTAAHAVGGATPVLFKPFKRVLKTRLGLGRGLSSGSRRYIALSFRTRDEDNAVFEAVPARTTSKLLAIIDMTQALSIFMVMAIQIGLIVRKRTASKGAPTIKTSRRLVTPSDPLVSLSEHQPLFLAWALACALFARAFAPRCGPPALPAKRLIPDATYTFSPRIYRAAENCEPI